MTAWLGAYAPIVPVALLAAWACGLLIGDLFIPQHRKGLTAGLTIVAIVMALLAVGWLGGATLEGLNGMVVADGLGTFFQAILLVGAAFSVALAFDYIRRTGIERGEYYILLLFSLSGMLLLAIASDLVMVFLGLELLSIPLYVLAGFALPKLELGGNRPSSTSSWAPSPRVSSSSVLPWCTGRPRRPTSARLPPALPPARPIPCCSPSGR